MKLPVQRGVSLPHSSRRSLKLRDQRKPIRLVAASSRIIDGAEAISSRAISPSGICTSDGVMINMRLSALRSSQ